MGCRAWRAYDRHAEARRRLTLPRWRGGPDRAGDRIAESIRIQTVFPHPDLASIKHHHPNISFGWSNATVSLQTKKIKGLHENDFIMAAKFDRLSGAPA